MKVCKLDFFFGLSSRADTDTYRLTQSEPLLKLIYINFINILYNFQEKNLIIILIRVQSEPFTKEKLLNETFHIQQC